MNSQPRGFTIVELLIVIVVIAILAAISIVTYNGIQQRAKASQQITALGQYVKHLICTRWKKGATRIPVRVHLGI